MLARSAFSHLESALGLFEQVAKNPRAAKVLVSYSCPLHRAPTILIEVQPVLRTQRDKAIASMHDIQARNPVILSRTGMPEEPKVKQEDDQLAKLGGITRLVVHRPSSLPASPTNSAGVPVHVATRLTPGARNSPTMFSSPTIPTPPASDFDSHWLGQGYGDPPPSYDYTNAAIPVDIWSHPAVNQAGFDMTTQLPPMAPVGQYSSANLMQTSPSIPSPYIGGPLQTTPQTPDELGDAWASFMAQFGRV